MRRCEDEEEVLVFLSVCSESVSLKLRYSRSAHVPPSCSRARQVIRGCPLGSEHYLNDIRLKNDILLQPPPHPSPPLPRPSPAPTWWTRSTLGQTLFTGVSSIILAATRILSFTDREMNEHLELRNGGVGVGWGRGGGVGGVIKVGKAAKLRCEFVQI